MSYFLQTLDVLYRGCLRGEHRARLSFYGRAFRLRPAGAALGTTLSQAVSVAVSLFVILRRKSGIKVAKKDFRPEKSVMKTILKIGVPVAFRDGLIQVSFIVITIIANRRCLNESATVGIVEKIMSFLFLFPSSMLPTISALGAQNIGAGKQGRAIETLRDSAAIAFGFGLLVALLVQVFAGKLVSLFSGLSDTAGAEVVRLGGQYLRGYVWDCVFAGISFSKKMIAYASSNSSSGKRIG